MPAGITYVATLEALGINRVAEIYQAAYDAQYGE